MATQTVDTITFFSNSRRGGVGSIIPFNVGYNINRLVEEHGQQYDITGAVYSSMVLSLSEMPGSMLLRQSNNFSEPTFPLTTRNEDGSNDTRNYNMETVKDMPEGPQKAFAMMFVQAIPAARSWLLDLTACHQVRSLTAQNIQGYFQSMNGTNVRGAAIIPILETSKNQIENILGNDSLRSLLGKNKFMEYHTTYSSTPGLVVRAVDDLRELINITDETQDKLDAALSNFWEQSYNDRIPSILVAITHCYLSVMGVLPNNWWQGEKAKNNVGVIIYRRWTAIIKRWADLTKNTDELDNAHDLAELRAAIPDEFRLL